MNQAKNKPLPSSEEMRVFASQFSKEDWNKLCSGQQFLDVFTEDLTEAKKIACKTLNVKLV